MEMLHEWFAKSEDGSVIWEYGDGEERTFQDVKDQQGTQVLGLKNRKTGKEYIVDLTRGLFGITPPDGQTEIMNIEGVSERDVTYKPVYFKKRRADIGVGGNAVGEECVHCLGFETTGKLEKQTYLLKVNDQLENLVTFSIE